MVSRYVSNFPLGLTQTAAPSGHPPHHPSPPQMSLNVAMAAAATAAANNSQQQQVQQQSQQSISLKNCPPNSSDYHVQQCLVQGAPQQQQQQMQQQQSHPQTSHPHFRIVHTRSDGYHVSAPTAGFSGQTGPPQQGPGSIRGISPTAPPTPPQDIKMQAQSTISLQQNYVPQNRQPQPNAYRNGQNPTSVRGPRQTILPVYPGQHMPPHLLLQYPGIPTTYTQSRQNQTPLYQPNHPVPYAAPTHLQSGYSYQPMYFPNASTFLPQSQRSGASTPMSGPQTNPNMAGPSNSQNAIMPPGTVMQSNQAGIVQKNAGPNKRREHAIKIIDPDSGRDILDEYLSGDQIASNNSSNTADLECSDQSHDLNNQHEQMTSGHVVIAADMLTGSNIDLIQHQHRINAMLNQHQQVQQQQQQQQMQQLQQQQPDITPTVSAISDGPAVDITPKQSILKKKNLSNVKICDSTQAQQQQQQHPQSINITLPPPPPPSTSSSSSSQKQKPQQQQQHQPIIGTTGLESAHSQILQTNASLSQMISPVPIVTTSGVSSPAATINTAFIDKSAKTQQQYKQPLDNSKLINLNIDFISSTIDNSDNISNITTTSKLSSSSSTSLQSITSLTSLTSIGPEKPLSTGQQQPDGRNRRKENVREDHHTSDYSSSTSLTSSPTLSTSNNNNINNNNYNEQETVAISNVAVNTTSVGVAASISTIVTPSAVTNQISTSTTSIDNTIESKTNLPSSFNKHPQQQQLSANSHQSDRPNNNINVKQVQQLNQHKDNELTTVSPVIPPLTKSITPSPSASEITSSPELSKTAKTNNNELIEREFDQLSQDKNKNITENIVTSLTSTQSTLLTNLSDKTAIIKTLPSKDETDDIQKFSHSKARMDSKVTIGSGVTAGNLTTAPAISNDKLTIKNINDNEENNSQNVIDQSEIDKENQNDKIVEQNNIINNQTLINYDEGQWSPFNPEGKKYYTPEQLMKLSEDPRSKAKPDLKCEMILKNNRLTSRSGDGGSIGFAQNAKIYASNTSSNENKVFPPFLQGGHMVSRGGGTFSKRVQGSGSKSSQSGINVGSGNGNTGSGASGSGSGGGKGSKSNVIHLSLSLREDIKLNETENAWKPSHLRNTEEVNEQDRATEELFRRFRSILNKLTPEKFQVLVLQVKTLKIDTDERLTGCMELVFEKAIDEPNFSVAYAKLCRQISTNPIQPSPHQQQQGEKPITVASAVQQQGTKSDDQIKNEHAAAAFKKKLLARCQTEFNHITMQTNAQEIHLKRLEECEDPDKKAEFQMILDEEERKLRRRALGTVRFIGELFKIELLTTNIMGSCLLMLLNNKNEESIECLCKLLTTIGQRMEVTPEPLINCFSKLQEILDKRTVKISSRVRFMIQDVIDLRKNKWVPRRPDLNPKTIGQIQKEAEAEQYNNQILNYNTARTERQRSGGGGGNISGSGSNYMKSGGGSGGQSGGQSGQTISGGGGGSGGRNVNEDGWSTPSSKGSRSSNTIDPNKLKTKQSNFDGDTPLGVAQTYRWTSGSNTSAVSPNIYSALSDLVDSRGSTSGSNIGKSKDSYYSKGSMERERYDGRGSQHKSRESSTTRSGGPSRSLQPPSRNQNIRPYSMSSSSQSGVREKITSNQPALSQQPQQSHQHHKQQQQTQMQQLQQITVPSNAISAEINLSVDQRDKLRLKMIDLLDEYIEGIVTLENYEEELNNLPIEHRVIGIFELYNCIVERSKRHRLCSSEILTHCLKREIISKENYLKALKALIDTVEDVAIDVPMIWDYLPEMIASIIHAGLINLRDLSNVSTSLIENDLGRKMLYHLFQYLKVEYDPQFIRDLWNNSKVQWTDFMKPEHVNSFIEESKYEFVTDRRTQPSAKTTVIDKATVERRIKEFLATNAKYDLVTEWITANVGQIDAEFIKALTTAVIESSLYPKSLKLNPQALKNYGAALLTRYIDNKEEFELQCLFTIQRLIFEWEFPPGLINVIFDNLYDTEVISSEGFLKWKDSDEQPEGKGVVLKCLSTFFNDLLANDSSDDGNKSP